MRKATGNHLIRKHSLVHMAIQKQKEEFVCQGPVFGQRTNKKTNMIS